MNRTDAFRLNRAHVVALAFALAVSAASAEVLDRPSGIKIGERMTLRPYVSMSITYDSNVEPNNMSRTAGKKDDFLWTVSPALWLHYNAETWSLILSGFYNFRQYFDSSHQNYNHHTFGEDLRWNWSNSTGAEKGWSLVLGQSYQQISMVDDMTLDGGQNYSGDSKRFQVAGAVQRRFNEHWHGDVNASYYWLDYDNDVNSRYAYYGWDRVIVGAEAGFAPSKWTDILVAGSYQYYDQDNVEGRSGVGDSSQGVSLQGGIGSYMTERISYRILAGWSMFDYGDGESKANGFVYTASGNWKIGETWNTMLLASSYYQPSERQYSSRSRVDAISWGIAKVMVRGKLRATFDIRYRHETNESATDSSWDYDLDIWTGRLGLDYTLCRFLSLFAYGEYQNSMNDEAERHSGAYDYDRWRITAGFRVQY